MRKTSRGTYFIAFAFLILGVAALVIFGLRGSGAYFVTVDEALRLAGDAPASMKLFGVVDADGGKALPGGAGLAFKLVDLEKPTQSIAVHFSGSIPPLFKPGAEIIARGVYAPKDRSFSAVELITKCPSKYEKQNREDE